MFRVSSHTSSPCERTALVPFPHTSLLLASPRGLSMVPKHNDGRTAYLETDQPRLTVARLSASAAIRSRSSRSPPTPLRPISGGCTFCQQDKEECDVCGVPLAVTVDLGAGRAKPPSQRLRAKWLRDAEVTSVNMHRLGESFVEKVSNGGRGERATPSSHMGREAGEQICGE